MNPNDPTSWQNVNLVREVARRIALALMGHALCDHRYGCRKES